MASVREQLESELQDITTDAEAFLDAGDDKYERMRCRSNLMSAAVKAHRAIERARAEPLPLGHWYVEGKATPGGNWSVLEGDPTKPGIKFQVAVVLTRKFAEYMVNTHNRGLERDDICTAACDQPSEQHCLDCGCYQAGYQAGTEAQRERVGGGTA